MQTQTYVNFEFRPGSPNSGWAQMTVEANDGCTPHCLTDWRPMTRAAAERLAKRHDATFRDHGAATA
jgi:hypothetical protein